MKLNAFFGGLCICMLASVAYGLPSTTPFLLLALGILLYVGYGYLRAIGLALFKTVKYFALDRRRNMKKKAYILAIRESIHDLKSAGYGDAPVQVLNKRANEYEKLFKDLSACFPDGKNHFDLSTTFDPVNPQFVLTVIKANSLDGIAALTELKNQLMKSQTKHHISFS